MEMTLKNQNLQFLMKNVKEKVKSKEKVEKKAEKREEKKAEKREEKMMFLILIRNLVTLATHVA